MLWCIVRKIRVMGQIPEVDGNIVNPITISREEYNLFVDHTVELVLRRLIKKVVFPLFRETGKERYSDLCQVSSRGWTISKCCQDDLYKFVILKDCWRIKCWKTVSVRIVIDRKSVYNRSRDSKVMRHAGFSGDNFWRKRADKWEIRKQSGQTGKT